MHEHDFDRFVADQFAQVRGGDPPAGSVDHILIQARRMRPLPRWLADLKEPPMHYRSHIAAGAPAFRLAILAAITVILTLALGAAVVAGASLLPGPAVVAPQLATDGLIAYDSNGDIMVVAPDGTHVQTIIGGPDTDTGPVWSPDGTRLAFWRQANGTGTHRVAVVAADGSDLRVYDSPGISLSGYDGGNPNLDWGPDDGRLMVRTTGWDAFLLDLATGVYTPVDLGGRSGRINNFDWSDDGSTVAFVSWDDYPHYEYVFETDLASGDTRQVVKADPVNGSLASVSVDPSGRRVAFSKGLDDPSYDGLGGQLERERIDLYVADVAAGAPSRLLQGKIYAPVWSPDGSHLAFGNGDGSLGIVGADGSDARTLHLTNVSAFDIGWAPDGQRTVTLTSDGTSTSNLAVTIADPAGKEAPVTIAAPGNVGSPSWQAVP